MKARTIFLTFVTCFVGLTLCFADNPHMGIWKLNEAKPKLSAGAPKYTTVIYEAVGDRVKVTVDGIDVQVSQHTTSGRVSSTAKTIR